MFQSKVLLGLMLLVAVCQASHCRNSCQMKRETAKAEGSELETLIRSLISALENRSKTPEATPEVTPDQLSASVSSAEVPDVPESPEVPEVVAEVSKAPKVPEAPKVAKVPEVTKAPEVAKAPKAPEVAKAAKVAKAPKAPKVAALSEDESAPDVAKAAAAAAKVAKAREVLPKQTWPGIIPLSFNVDPAAVRFVRAGPIEFGQSGSMAIPTIATFKIASGPTKCQACNS